MVDYTKSTGSSGTMMIRDTGSDVEFWLKAGSSTFSYDLPWRYYNGGWSTWREFRFESGGSWQKLGETAVSTTRTISFSIGDSGTNGLAGPTTLSVTINRDAKPDPPGPVSLTQILYQSVYATFVDGSNNGDAIDARQIGYGTSSTTPTTIVSSDRSTSITGLLPGTKYYFWARTHNSLGWSGWSSRREATTLAGAWILVQTGTNPIRYTWKRAIPYVRTAGVWKQAIAYVRSAGVWKESK